MDIKTEGLTPEQVEKLKAMQEGMLAENSKPISRYHFEVGYHCDELGLKYVEKEHLYRHSGRLRETMEEAVADYEAWQCRLRLLKRIAELNEGWEADLASSHCYCLGDNTARKTIGVWLCTVIQYLHKDFYFKSIEIGEQLLEEFTEDEIKAAMWGCV